MIEAVGFPLLDCRLAEPLKVQDIAVFDMQIQLMISTVNRRGAGEAFEEGLPRTGFSSESLVVKS